MSRLDDIATPPQHRARFRPVWFLLPLALVAVWEVASPLLQATLPAHHAHVAGSVGGG